MSPYPIQPGSRPRMIVPAATGGAECGDTGRSSARSHRCSVRLAEPSTPTRSETKAALHRAANEFMWDLVDMRKIEKPDPLTAELIKLYESRASFESELKKRFLRKETS